MQQKSISRHFLTNAFSCMNDTIPENTTISFWININLHVSLYLYLKDIVSCLLITRTTIAKAYLYKLQTHGMARFGGCWGSTFRSF